MNTLMKHTVRKIADGQSIAHRIIYAERFGGYTYTTKT